MIMTRQPKMMVQIFPIIFATDWIKGRAVSYMTSRIENLQKDDLEYEALSKIIDNLNEQVKDYFEDLHIITLTLKDEILTNNYNVCLKTYEEKDEEINY